MTLAGNPLDYAVAFLGGVLVSFTPCVYPLIPVTASFIGANSGGTKLKGLFLSLAYVSGVALTYSLLGVLAILSGTVFGKFSRSPITHAIVGAVFILFGFSMLDFFTLPFPRIVKLPVFKKGNYLSAFFLGLSSGLMVSPCLTPVLGAILVYLSTQKNLFYGVTLLFTFAYGMGTLLILVGVFSGALVNIPKSGKWMLYIKRALAFVLIGIGVYFIFGIWRRI